MKNQHQWEGFETLNDAEQKTISFPNEAYKPALHKQIHAHARNRKRSCAPSRRQMTIEKNRTLKIASVNTLETPIMLNDIPQGFPAPISQQQLQGGKIKGGKDLGSKRQIRGENKLIRKLRFTPIPILYDLPIDQFRGRVVYRGFLPRTSDGYFRLLKQVDWNAALGERKGARNTLQFNSKFESGNLASACQYDLYIRPDTNTNGHMQWFYFSVKNSNKMKVKFNVFRFRKCYSLFQRGFRPYVRSRRQGGDWVAGGERVKYYRQHLQNENGVKKPSNYFYLSFLYSFQHQHDQVFFAACIPYTVTHLQRRLLQFQGSFSSQLLNLEIKPFCATLCGQEIQLITIEPKSMSHNLAPKHFIVINSRTHSGETSASWVADGLLQMLLKDEDIHRWMVSKNLCFKIVPMLNKDGVFMGNYRTGIVGDDFNRRFSSGQRQFFPEISALKRLVQNCKKMGKVHLFLDLHGHSILKSSFIFGPDRRAFEHEQLMELGDVLKQISKYFSSVSSHYRNQKGKTETARVFFQLEEEILSLTCQNSLGLYTDQCQTYQHTAEDWRMFGRHVLTAIQLALSQTKLQQNVGSSLQMHKVVPSNQVYLKNIEKKQLNKCQVSVKMSKDQLMKKKGGQKLEKKVENVGINKQKSKMRVEDEQVCSKKSSKQKKQEKSRKSVESSIDQKRLQKSIILTRYGEMKSQFEDKSTLEMRASKTVHPSSESLKVAKQMLFGEEEIIPDNFSEGYESINDSDTSEDDIEMSKREQIFKCIRELEINNGANYQEQQQGHNSKQCLLPLKGFKEIKFSIDKQEVFSADKKPPLYKLKPLKYQEFKARGMTEKKIKNNLDILLANQSLVATERDKAKMLINKNQILWKYKKNSKKEQVMAEIFPHLEEHEYLLMRIKEMKLQSQRDVDK